MAGDSEYPPPGPCGAPAPAQESLSPPTAESDFAVGLGYLIYGQDEPRARGWQRQGDSITFSSANVELAMAAIFHGIPDVPTVEQGDV